MVLGKSAPFCVPLLMPLTPPFAGISPITRCSSRSGPWLAFCITAVLVTNSICWARFARASLGTYAMAALSWMFRHSKIPWEHLLVASVRVILRHHGLTSGSLVIHDTDNPRSKSAKARAYCINYALKQGAAISGGKASFFSSW